jgi:hypothetical protein
MFLVFQLAIKLAEVFIYSILAAIVLYNMRDSGTGNVLAYITISFFFICLSFGAAVYGFKEHLFGNEYS